MTFPDKLKGTIFTEVIPQMLPEIDFSELLELGVIVKAKGKTSMYESLKSSLRKIQWVKFVGLKAVAIEKDVRNNMGPNILLMDPLGQIDHSLSMTDILIHTKSALDSMAVFLTDLLGLDLEGGERDLKKSSFRTAVKAKDTPIGNVINRLESWLIYVQRIRDEWIHKDSVRSVLVSGISEVGALPIPKNPSLAGKFPPVDMKINSKNFWSTQDFVNYHYSRLITLFQVIARRSIEIEKGTFKGEIPKLEPAEIEMAKSNIFFPTRLTTKTTIKQLKASSINLSVYFKRLSECLPKEHDDLVTMEPKP